MSWISYVRSIYVLYPISRRYERECHKRKAKIFSWYLTLLKLNNFSESCGYFSFFSSKSSLDTGRLWMNSLSEMTKARQTRQEQLEGSLLNFTKLIYCKFDEKRTDGLKSFEEYKKSYRQKKGIVRKLWQYQKRFLLSERGAWGFKYVIFATFFYLHGNLNR